MAKQQRKQDAKGFLDRFNLWMNRNQKVMMVVLLLLIAPFFAFTGPVYEVLSPQKGAGIVEKIYGEEITQADMENTLRLIRAVDRVWSDPLFGFSNRAMNFPLTMRDGISPLFALRFHAYREKARRLGLHVSDEEIQNLIRNIWRDHAAAKYAAEKVAGKVDPRNPWASFNQRRKLSDERKEQLEKADAFESSDWQRLVSMSLQRRTRGSVREFEEMLRDVLLVGKLEDYVKASVYVTPEEVYEEYREQDQRRTLSWVAVTPTDELKAAVREGIKDEILEPYYDAHLSYFEEKFGKFALKATYLILPEDHFRKKAEESVADKDLEDYYQRERNSFRRADILPEETQFKLRTKEEQDKFELALYKPLEEVKDEVREKVIDQKTSLEMRTFSSKMSQRLLPAEGSDKKPATVEELVKEFPFLKSGQTEFLSREDSEEGFGEGYHEMTVSNWFDTAEKESGRRVKLEVPKSARSLGEGKGMVFYSKVETRAARIPRFKDIEAEVKDVVVLEESMKLISRALQDIADKINEPDADAETKETLDSFAESAELKVKVSDDREVAVALSPLDDSRGYIKRDTQRGRLMVLKQEEEEEDGAVDESEDSKVEEEDEQEKEEEHPHSDIILKVCFSLEEKGQVAVTSKVGTEETPRGQRASATDKGEPAAYLVRFNDLLYPDPGGFEDRRQSLKSSLLSEKQEEHFTSWRSGFFEEAFGGSSPVLGAEAKEVAQK